MNVEDMLDLLEGHDWDREIKLKLHDGRIKEIEGFKFRNACVGGDDIIYIVEKNPLREKYGEEIRELTDFTESILKFCEAENLKGLAKYGDNWDGDYIKTIMIGLCNEMDFYIKKCKLERYVEKKLGYYEEGCGCDDEAYIKLDVLQSFIL